MPFAVPVVWREQTDHLTDCSFCLTIIVGHISKSKHTIVYPNIPSALRPVEHDDSLPIPKPPQQLTLHEKEPTSTYPEDEPGPSCSSVSPDFLEQIARRLILQSEFNYQLTDLNLSKIQAELLAYRLQGWNCYSKVLKCHTGKHQHSLSSFFNDGKLVY